MAQSLRHGAGLYPDGPLWLQILFFRLSVFECVLMLKYLYEI
jgi:hypothetical protein